MTLRVQINSRVYCSQNTCRSPPGSWGAGWSTIFHGSRKTVHVVCWPATQFRRFSLTRPPGAGRRLSSKDYYFKNIKQTYAFVRLTNPSRIRSTASRYIKREMKSFIKNIVSMYPDACHMSPICPARACECNQVITSSEHSSLLFFCESLFDSC